MTVSPVPIDRESFAAHRLMTEHPPLLGNRNKRVVFEIACPAECRHTGEIHYTRWPVMERPESVVLRRALPRVEAREDAYDYEPVAHIPDAVEWHVNFADPHLFCAYGAALFAQDEMQVAEHPGLGALREALVATGKTAVTVESGSPTPVLVRGVERRCRLATDRNAAAGRPRGLYGNAFGQADADAIRRATTRIDPPTITNVIAMAAPRLGYGAYTARQIRYAMDTAFTAFRAAVIESDRHKAEQRPVVVHTGFWGCGAFGGDRVLMAMIQVLAAEMAGVTHLVFHTFDAAGSEYLAEALRTIERELGGDGALHPDQVIDRLVALGFEWGVSDGN